MQKTDVMLHSEEAQPELSHILVHLIFKQPKKEIIFLYSKGLYVSLPQLEHPWENAGVLVKK